MSTLAGGPAVLALLASATAAGAVLGLIPARPGGVRQRLRATPGLSDPTRPAGASRGRLAWAAAPARVALLLAGALAAYLGAGAALSVNVLGGVRAALGPLSPTVEVPTAIAELGRLGVAGAAPAVILAAVIAIRSRRRTHRGAARSRRRRAVIEGVLVLAAELRAGTPALPALESAAESAPELGPPARVGRLGGDVAGALRRAGAAAGADGLSWLAAAWTVSAEMGAALASTVEELVEILRAEDLAQEDTESALAASRATARLLCALPLAGLGMGTLIGADPWQALTGTRWGPGLAIVAVLLAGAGLEWVERLAASAENPGRDRRPGPDRHPGGDRQAR